MPAITPALLSADETAAYLGRSVQNLYYHVKKETPGFIKPVAERRRQAEKESKDKEKALRAAEKAVPLDRVADVPAVDGGDHDIPLLFEQHQHSAVLQQKAGADDLKAAVEAISRKQAAEAKVDRQAAVVESPFSKPYQFQPLPVNACSLPVTHVDGYSSAWFRQSPVPDDPWGQRLPGAIINPHAVSQLDQTPLVVNACMKAAASSGENTGNSYRENMRPLRDSLNRAAMNLANSDVSFGSHDGGASSESDHLLRGNNSELDIVQKSVADNFRKKLLKE